MPTKQEYRRQFLKLVGPFETGTADNSSDTSRLVCTSNIFKSTTASSGTWKDKWLTRPSASTSTDKYRTVYEYDPDNGYLSPDLTWTNAPDGETFEIGIISGELADAMVTEALKSILTPTEFTLSVADYDYNRHSLAAVATWLTQPHQVRQVGTLTSGQDRNEVNPYARLIQGEVQRISGVLYLVGPKFVSTETVYVAAHKPAYYDCSATGGSYGSQTGLSAESDIAIPPVELVAQLAILRMLEREEYLDTVKMGHAERMARRHLASVRFRNLYDSFMAAVAFPLTFRKRQYLQIQV